MPIYNMICTNEECDYKNNNYWCKISEKENQLCPECDSLLKSVISSSNFIKS